MNVKLTIMNFTLYGLLIWKYGMHFCSSYTMFSFGAIKAELPRFHGIYLWHLNVSLFSLRDDPTGVVRLGLSKLDDVGRWRCGGCFFHQLSRHLGFRLQPSRSQPTRRRPGMMKWRSFAHTRTHTDTHVQKHTVQIHTYRFTHTDTHIQIHTYRFTHTD